MTAFWRCGTFRRPVNALWNVSVRATSPRQRQLFPVDELQGAFRGRSVAPRALEPAYLAALRVFRSMGPLPVSILLHSAVAITPKSVLDKDRILSRYCSCPAGERDRGVSIDPRWTPFVLTDIGEGIVEVEILRWHVQEGDYVRPFDALVDVQSDKATVEITSRFQGVVRHIPHRVGELAKVGEALCFIEVSDDAPSAETLTQAPDKLANTGVESVTTAGTNAGASAEPAVHTPGELNHNEVSSSQTPYRKRVRTTPALRGLARERGIDLAKVTPSGPGRRILPSDIELFLGAQQERGAPALSEQNTPAALGLSNATTKPEVGGTAVGSGSAGWRKALMQRDRPTLGEHVTAVPIRGLRRAMAKSLAAAAVVPHLVYGEEATVDRLIDLRRELTSFGEHRLGSKLTYMPFFIKATSVALEGFPILNATLDNVQDPKNILYQRDHNISIAIDTPDGLIVPNIKKVQQLSVFDIAQELRRLQELAHAGKLNQDDLSGGTFALSNIGSIGGIHASPVIMVPQVAISALGRIRRVPRFASDQPTAMNERYTPGSLVVYPAHVMTIVVAADHRIIDGATVANFCARWKLAIESPAALLLGNGP